MEPTSLRLVRYLTASPASNHPVNPRRVTVARPIPKMNELSERYCGAGLLSVEPAVPLASPTKRIEIYGRKGNLPSFMSVLTWPYPNASCQRLEKKGKAQAVVRKRANDGARFREAWLASVAIVASGLLLARLNHLTASRSSCSML